MQYINKKTIAFAVLLLILGVQSYFIYSLEQRLRAAAPILVEAYNGQNFLGKVMYEVGILEKGEGDTVIINPNLPTRSQQP